MDEVEESAPPLTLALNSNPPTPENEIPQKRRSMGNFTLDARRKLLRAGGALARFDPVPSHCLFLTGTLPGSTPASYRTIARYSAEIVNRVKSWIHKKYNEHAYSFYCWELQKRGALHLHYLLYCPVQEVREKIMSTFKKFWTGLLLSISEKSCVDMFQREKGGTHRDNLSVVQAYAMECRKSVAAYMAKYVGKDAGKGNTENFPSRWSSVSRPLTALIREYSEEVKFITPSYTRARNIYETSAEELTDSHVVTYSYRHKVGVGDTCITYYKDDTDLQSCQFNQVSLTMNSNNSTTQFTTDLRTATLASLCLTHSSPLILRCFPDFAVNSSDLQDSLRSILLATLKEFCTECHLNTSEQQLKNILTAQLAWMSCVNSGTRSTSAQISYQAHLMENVSLLHKNEGLGRMNRHSDRFQEILRKRLTPDMYSDYRSTTTLTSTEVGEEPTVCGTPEIRVTGYDQGSLPL